ncbi:MAG: hypothetical protein IPO62_11380 [Saprospiraceae bacterium]|nr:hypothetical protein [Saprospiraceae bacterium]
MVYLILSILFTFSLGLLFRLFPKNIRIPYVITINYIVCAVIGILGHDLDYLQLNLKSYIFSAWMGSLFCLGFNLYALSVRNNGLGLSTVFQKFSIVLSITAACMLGERLHIFQWIGVGLAFPAIYLLIGKSLLQKHPPTALGTGNFNSKNNYKLLMGILLISAFIEISLILINKVYFFSNSSNMTNTSLIFAGAAIVSLLMLYFKKRALDFKIREIGAGILLGIPNFFSIHLINVALAEQMPASLIFPILNCSVLGLSVVTGFLIFHENLDHRKRWGLLAAIIAIGLIAFF